MSHRDKPASTDAAVAAPPSSPPDHAALGAEMLALREDVRVRGDEILAGFGAAEPVLPEIANLAHYLTIRHRDLRALQRRLMCLGLSSLGRMESRVLPTLDAVIHALGGPSGAAGVPAAPSEAAFFAGEARLVAATDALFGRARENRRGRIMVTLPGSAAEDAGFVLDLVERGMDVARINCAHDDVDAWRKMAAHARAAAASTGHDVRVLMDIGGPKIRTAAVAVHDKHQRMGVDDRLVICTGGKPEASKARPFVATVSLPQIVASLAIGDRVLYDDGKMEAVVEEVEDGAAVLKIRRIATGGLKLKVEKGLNLPDTALGLSPLTAQDETDLDAVIECADMIGYSFVCDADDIDLLETALARKGIGGKTLGLVAKIERPEAIGNLPKLIARALGHKPFGIMIARGDLAAEIGFERLAEMQEEILWICEAAAVPAIWATQVLEDLVKTGVPSRGEMTDAAMAARAECVMLNKGPEVGAAVDLLDSLIARMGDNIWKKTPILRALRSW
jgi:pyruvate kinase